MAWILGIVLVVVALSLLVVAGFVMFLRGMVKPDVLRDMDESTYGSLVHGPTVADYLHSMQVAERGHRERRMNPTECN